jgi:NADP-dependent 3-hydroxy acid dehydrogenase YdfG
MKQTILISGASPGFDFLKAEKLHESDFQVSYTDYPFINNN